MTLSQVTLASALDEKLQGTTDEASAITNFVSAWEVYFNESQVGPAFATPGSYDAALTAMRLACVGQSAPGAAPLAWQNAIIAFWAALAPIITTVWVTTPVVLIPPATPPLDLGTIAAALTVVFLINREADREEAMNNIASVLHIGGGIGGFVSGSVPPTPPALIPIT